MDDKDRDELRTLIQAELSKLMATDEIRSAVSAAAREARQVIEIRHVGVPLGPVLDPRIPGGLIPGGRAMSGDNCCNGCD